MATYGQGQELSAYGLLYPWGTRDGKLAREMQRLDRWRKVFRYLHIKSTFCSCLHLFNSKGRLCTVALSFEAARERKHTLHFSFPSSNHLTIVYFVAYLHTRKNRRDYSSSIEMLN